MIDTGHLRNGRKQTSEIASALAAARAHYSSERRNQEEWRELRVELTQLYRHYLAQDDRLFLRPNMGVYSDPRLDRKPTA